MTLAFRQELAKATLIFDPVDSYAQARRLRGKNPRPLGELRFWLVAEVGTEGRQDLAQPIRLRPVRTPSGYHVFFDRIQLKAQEYRERRRLTLRPGSYVVQVKSDFYQPVELQGKVPMPTRNDPTLPDNLRLDVAMPVPYKIELAPSYAYPFLSYAYPKESDPNRARRPTLLRGSLHHRDGRGIEGAVVSVALPGESEPQVGRHESDQTGQWILLFPDAQPGGVVEVKLNVPANPEENRPAKAFQVQVPLEPGPQNSLPETALRGWVMTVAGLPVKGGQIRVSGQPAGKDPRSSSDGSWFYYFDPDQQTATVDVTAELDDGRTQTKQIGVEQRKTIIVPTFRF